MTTLDLGKTFSKTSETPSDFLVDVPLCECSSPARKGTYLEKDEDYGRTIFICRFRKCSFCIWGSPRIENSKRKKIQGTKTKSSKRVKKNDVESELKIKKLNEELAKQSEVIIKITESAKKEAERQKNVLDVTEKLLQATTEDSKSLRKRLVDYEDVVKHNELLSSRYLALLHSERLYGEAKPEYTCCVCLTAPSNILFHPCKHLKTCGPCSAQVEECPICKAIILTKDRVFT